MTQKGDCNPKHTSVHQRSKKIQKSKTSFPRQQNSQCDNVNDPQKYKTFGNSEKKKIISSLKHALLNSDCHLLKDEISTSQGLLEFLDLIDVDIFTQALEKILHKYVDSFEPTVVSLRKWRKKIREWLGSIDKPEKRGSLLVPNDKLEEFKGFLKLKIKELSHKNLDLLKEKLFPGFELIGKPIKDKNACSKHWWYDFLDKNPDIKTLWEDIPRKRRNKKGKEFEILIGSCKGALEKKGIKETKIEVEEETADSFSPKSSNFSEGFDLLIEKNSFSGDFLMVCSPSLIDEPQNRQIQDEDENMSSNFTVKNEEIEFFINPFVLDDEMRYNRF